ncbi:MAG: hypothetical protein A2Y17_02535 [Clostridiales bacterium GWF2_38_85]|nr:MAG: hypothetical protein A2Y17_02535 [Clostridiales bacterium GWF2_38_85]HBL85075.1 hypothetical protein [Clostridiales bacterium]
MENVFYRIAYVIGSKNGFDDERIKVIAYGLMALSQTIGIFILSSVLGIIFGCLYESLAIFFIVGFIRKYTGGAHATTLISCMIISVTVILSMSAVARYTFSFVFKQLSVIDIRIIIIIVYVLIYSLIFITVFKLAPVDSPNKPIKKPEKIKRLKNGSRIIIISLFLSSIVLVWFSKYNYRFFTVANSALFATLWQTLTLTKTGHKLINVLDRFIRIKKLD